MRWITLLVLIQTTLIIPQINEDYGNRISFPHLYPGQKIISSNRFFDEALKPGTSTVRWTNYGSYSINLDKIHPLRNSYTLIIRSKKGPDIRILPHDTTKIYLYPDYYKIKYDENTYTIWLSKHPI